MNQSHDFALNLVRHFLPSANVAKYQFRGMQHKSATMDIAFEDLSLELPSGARVLKGVTGSFSAGRLCAIMGPSGAGKTTFMNTLCGKATYGKMSGTIRVNGEEKDITEFRSVIGFVPQDDIVHEELTVREQIQFSAKLRNKPGMKEKRIKALTDDVLNVMQIAHIQSSIVGGVEQRGISGGQRKRVNIGLELAAQPTVLFLDEPTSGLDSTSSLSVAVSLKKMCQLGTTSIMVIHQPRYSLFTLFDDVLLLGKGGQTVYLGPSLGVKPYFESLGFSMPANENPADWFMDVISGEVPNRDIADFRPCMLFDLWEERGEEFVSRQRMQRAASRRMTSRDEKALLQRKLEEEWDMIDTSRDGFLQEEELKALLTRCSPSAPDSQVVRELFMRMAGETATFVSKLEFVDYLMSLHSVVAHDRLLSNLGEEEGDEEDTRSNSEASSIDIEAQDSMASSTGASTGLHRPIPGFRQQLQMLLCRRLAEWWRKNRQRALFFGALAAGAIILAIMDRFLLSTPRWDAGAFLYTHSALSLLMAIFCLQVFGNDQQVFLRECSSGLNVQAYFLSRLWVNTFDVVFQTFTFTSLYFLIRQPQVHFYKYMVPYLLVAYASSGWGYLISTVVPPKHGPFVVSLVVFIVCCVLGDPIHLNDFLDGGVFEVIVSVLSITRWSVPLNVNYQIEYTKPQPADPTKQMELASQKVVFAKGMWDSGYWWTCVVYLLIIGTYLRVLAAVGLRFLSRRKSA
jgi:ABC-type multidrug transport system ATPase subunit